MLIAVGRTRKDQHIHKVVSYLQIPNFLNLTNSLSIKFCVTRYQQKFTMTTSSLPCANCNADGSNCPNLGSSSCKKCRLVVVRGRNL